MKDSGCFNDSGALFKGEDRNRDTATCAETQHRTKEGKTETSVKGETEMEISGGKGREGDGELNVTG